MQAKAAQTLNMAKTEGIKRKLKPVIEKKRRDRINHNLDALKYLLFKTTSDTRLQNPKLEKAEILDLAVQYIRKTTRKPETKVTSNEIDSKSRNQSVISVSAGLIYTTDVQAYTSDFCGRLNLSQRIEASPKLKGNPGINKTCAPKVGSEWAIQTGISQEKIVMSPSGQNGHKELVLHPESSLYGWNLSLSLHYNSPPSSPTFNSNSPPNLSSSCLLPLSFPPPDTLPSLTTAPLNLNRPVIMPEPILPCVARYLTPPQSPVLSFRQEHFPLSARSTWRPWS